MGESIAKKKHWLDKFDSVRSVILGLYVVLIALIVEGVRFFINLPFKDEIIMKEVMGFIIPWAAGVLLVVVFIVLFSNNLEEKKKK